MRRTLDQLLRQSAEAYPDAIAIKFGETGVTYRELWAEACRVAGWLEAHGVRRGDRVGILIRKSPHTVAAIFGALLAGCPYVPLDASSPPARLEHILGNCGVRVLITEKNLARIFAAAPVLLLIDDPETWRGETLPASDTHHDIVDADLAAILYTSGSTGQPKGVMLSHRNIMNFVEWGMEEFHLTPSDRLTSHAPAHFDLSTFDIFAGVGAGATVVLVPEAVAILAAELLDLLARERITVTYMVPFSLSLLVTVGDPSRYDLTPLRTVLFAGETFPLPHLRRLVRCLPGARFYNLYGPTETNVCTWHEVTPEDLAEGNVTPVPIGRACPNVGVFALNADGRPVTIPGQSGELWVRGAGVAVGYWGDPELTASRFRSNPLMSDYPDPAYRTGDSVTLGADGKNWFFQGRSDCMVKSRGFRIELGDIEACLYRSGEIRDAVVVAPRNELTGARIVAFVVPVDNQSPQENRLLSWCRGQLPRYMVPERIFLRGELPRTSSGKLNRKQLEHEAGTQ